MEEASPPINTGAADHAVNEMQLAVERADRLASGPDEQHASAPHKRLLTAGLRTNWLATPPF
eukprot:2199738-Lingulodinium_polyedra.AAC.1